MNRKEKSKAAASGMALVHPNAAAIDIGVNRGIAATGVEQQSGELLIECPFELFKHGPRRMALPTVAHT